MAWRASSLKTTQPNLRRTIRPSHHRGSSFARRVRNQFPNVFSTLIYQRIDPNRELRIADHFPAEIALGPENARTRPIEIASDHFEFEFEFEPSEENGHLPGRRDARQLAPSADFFDRNSERLRDFLNDRR